MTIITKNSVQEALNLSVILTEACSRPGAAGNAMRNMQDALGTKPQDPRIVRLAELFTSEMVGSVGEKARAEMNTLITELGAETVTLPH